MIQNGSAIDDSKDIEVTNGPLGFGWAINIDDNRDEDSKLCLKMDVKYLSEADEMCFQNPSNCELGFSCSIWVKIEININDESERYIFSTGIGTIFLYFYTLLSY